MKAHSCRNSRVGGHDANPLCLLLCGHDRWGFFLMPLSEYESALACERWVRAHCPASGAARFSLTLMSPDRQTTEEILEYKNRRGISDVEYEKRRLKVSVSSRFSHSACNYVRACRYSNQHRIFPFQKKFEIVLDDNGRGMIWAFFSDDVSVLLIRNTRGSGIHTHKYILTHSLCRHTNTPCQYPADHCAHAHTHGVPAAELIWSPSLHIR